MVHRSVNCEKKKETRWKCLKHAIARICSCFSVSLSLSVHNYLFVWHYSCSFGLFFWQWFCSYHLLVAFCALSVCTPISCLTIIVWVCHFLQAVPVEFPFAWWGPENWPHDGVLCCKVLRTEPWSLHKHRWGPAALRATSTNCFWCLIYVAMSRGKVSKLALQAEVLVEDRQHCLEISLHLRFRISLLSHQRNWIHG